MFNRRINRMFAEGRGEKNSPSSLRTEFILRRVEGRFIFFIFLFSSSICFAITDTTKTNKKYELNDPRNPDCPCHKLQKQADDEFATLNANRSTSKSIGTGNKFKRRKKNVFIYKLEKHFLNTQTSFWKCNRHTSDCFHW